MGNFCVRSETEDSLVISKATIGPDYQEFPNKIAGDGVKATAAWQATITRAQLNARREEFWRSRTQGKRRMWLAIKAAVETDSATALSIIQNAKLSLKTGNLTLLEDEDGGLYSVPIYIINNPISFDKEKKQKTREPKNEGDIKIKIRKPGQSSDEELQILNSAKVEEVKKLYAARALIDYKQVRLFFGGKEMKDVATLANLFVEDGMVIQVFVKQ
jgi:Ubiquitin-binding domain/Ubiquitin family